MPHDHQFASDEMCISTSLHNDSTDRQIAEECHHLTQALLAEHLSTRFGLATQVKTVFAEINTVA